MIEFKKISKKYGNFQALSEVNFTVEKGKITALLGPNGAGKTTTMKILTGFLEPSGGKVEIDGIPLTNENRERLQQNIGYLPENAPLYPELNVWEHLDFASRIRGVPANKREESIVRVAKSCGLTEKIYFDVSELSKGYKQRLGLAQAIIHDPQILILDEPTTGLDPNQILEIRKLISSWRKDKTILLSTHIMQEVEAMADNVLVLSSGEIVQSSSKAKFSNQDASEVFHFLIELEASKVEMTKAQKLIEKISSVKSVSVEEQKLDVIAEEDCRSEISKSMLGAKLNLVGLNTKKTSIEEVFRNLTKK